MTKKVMVSLVCLVVLGFLGACGNNEEPNKKVTSSMASSSSLTVSSSADSENVNSATDLAQRSFAVSMADAVAVFMGKHPDTVITEIDFDTDFGAYKYKISGVDKTTEYQLKVDAESKEVTKEEQEALDSDESNGIAMEREKVDIAQAIAPQKAIESAVKAAKEQGNMSGGATEWSLEADNQQMVYTVQIQEAQTEIEVKLDAQNGKIIGVEKD